MGHQPKKDGRQQAETTQEKMMWATAIKAIGPELSKPFGTPINPSLDLHAGRHVAEFNACFPRF